MSGYRRPHRTGRIVGWLIGLGILIGVGYVWGDEILYYATGQDIVDRLRDDLAVLPGGRPTVTPQVSSTLPPPTAISDAPVLVDRGEIGPDGFPVRPRMHVLKYTVQPGDALFLIAQRFGIHPNTIFWANPDTLKDNVHLLHVGMELYILPVNGLYHLSDGKQSIAEIASLYGVTAGDILYSEYNDLAQYDSEYVPPAGLRIVVPGGRRDYVSWQSPIRTGTQSGAANPEGSLHPGSCRAQYSGAGGEGNYIHPLGNIAYRVTNGFTPWHPGVDMAADRGTPIYAIETGVVVFAGWHRDGYGELVIVDHGDGWTSYYAHLARRFVDCGQQISKGQLIAEMGMSGNATGVHLHLEIRHNDVPQNPYSYIDIQDAREDSDG